MGLRLWAQRRVIARLGLVELVPCSQTGIDCAGIAWSDALSNISSYYASGRWNGRANQTIVWLVREQEILLMFQRKSLQAGPERRRLGRYIAANPLWPLEELRDLRNPPFVPDPEYSPLDIRALGPHPEDPAAPPSVPARVHPLKHRRFHTVRREFPIPH